MEREFAQIFADQLLPDEKVLWAGQPDRGKIFSPQDIFVVPFSLLWAGFAVFWTIGAMSANAVFGLFGLPFVAVGIYIVFGRFVAKWLMKAKTYYAITDSRVIAATASPISDARKVSAMRIADIQRESASVGSRGIGTLVFGNAAPDSLNLFNAFNMLSGFAGASSIGGVVFQDIQDCNEVYRIYKDLKYAVPGADS